MKDGTQVEKTRRNLRLQVGPIDLYILTVGGDRKIDFTEGIERRASEISDQKKVEDQKADMKNRVTEGKED